MNIVEVDRLYNEKCEKEKIHNYSFISINENNSKLAVEHSRIMDIEHSRIMDIEHSYNNITVKRIQIMLYFVLNSLIVNLKRQARQLYGISVLTIPKSFNCRERLEFSTTLFVLSNTVTNNLVNYLNQMLYIGGIFL